MKQKITQKMLKDAAKDSFFNPRAPGPLSVVAEHSSVEYCLMRAIESIGTAQTEDFDKQITNAIALLLLAKVKRGTIQTKANEKGRT